MKIEVWSDYVCPFCYIGKRQLEKALETSGYSGHIDVEFKSFLLDPTTPLDSQDACYDALAAKFNKPVAEIKTMTAGIAARAKDVGLHFDFDTMKTANTSAAHRLVKWAAEQGQQAALSERFMRAYFVEGQAIGLPDVLVKLVEDIGLDGAQARQILLSNQYEPDIQQDIVEAQQLGVRGVPFFVIDRKYAISGAQPQSVFEETIEMAAREAGLPRPLHLHGNSGAACTDDACKS